MVSISSAEGLKEELERIQNANRCSKDRSFLHWYLNHNFEKEVKYEITDGPNDGCIDAIVELKRGRMLGFAVVQAKYCEAIFKRRQPSPLPIASYMEYDALPETFSDQNKFEEYLKTVDSSLHSAYRDLAKHIRSGQDVSWQLATLHGRSRAGENRLRHLNDSCFRYAADNLFLYDLSLEGAEPPADPMRLTFSDLLIFDDPHRRMRSYVLRARLMDFIDYVEKDPKFQVLARNVRSDLKSEINRTIRATYEENADEFWYSHNGITIICRQATVRGKSINLEAPSIINGAQTIHALRESDRRNPVAQVLVRVIEIPWKDEQETRTQARSLIGAIIFRTNQQNRMYRYDLRSNDPLQVSLARQFLTKKIFYERKRGEWKLNQRRLKNQGLRRLTIKQLAQILCACDERVGGVSTAKRTIEQLFADKKYEHVFEPDFSEVFLKLKLHDFLLDCLWYKTRFSNWIEAKQRLLTSLSILWHSIESERSLRDWEQVMLKKLPELSIWDQNCRPLVRCTKDVFGECWKLYKLQRRKDKTLTPKNFFRNEEANQKMLKTLVPKFGKKMVKALSEAFSGM